MKKFGWETFPTHTVTFLHLLIASWQALQEGWEAGPQCGIYLIDGESHLAGTDSKKQTTHSEAA